MSELEAEVASWLAANWDPGITVAEWWERLADAGYAHPRWPRGMGGFGATREEARTVTSVLAARGVVAAPTGHVGANLAVPTILAHGDDAQIRKFVPAVATGRASFCQLFSEPGSGSDLASIATRAESDGGRWVVNGQKVWNSGADTATYGLLLARTDPDVPKHAGLSYFIIDMDQAGVEARPLRQMDGGASFCEVFLSEAEVSSDRLLSGLGEGWRVAQTTLANERASVAGRGVDGLAPALSGEAGGDLQRTVREVVARASTTRSRRIRGAAIPTRLMLELATAQGLAGDALVRQELARYYTQNKVNAWTNARIAVARGGLTGADGSFAKLTISRICQKSRDLSLAVLGARGMLVGRDAPWDGELASLALASPGTRIGGGTDEIQLNVLGERALGLPREPSPNKNVPYRQLEVGTRRSP